MNTLAYVPKLRPFVIPYHEIRIILYPYQYVRSVYCFSIPVYLFRVLLQYSYVSRLVILVKGVAPTLPTLKLEVVVSNTAALSSRYSNTYGLAWLW